MDHPTIFSATLGLSHPWQVTSVALAREEGRLDITLHYAAPSFSCPDCGAERACDTAGQETWVHSDFFRYHTYLHARIPQAKQCLCGNDLPPARPWCRAGSRFRLLEEPEER